MIKNKTMKINYKKYLIKTLSYLTIYKEMGHSRLSLL